MPIFYDKGYLVSHSCHSVHFLLHVCLQLRDKWVQQIDEAGGIVNTDVLLGLSRATLDIIGLAGFDYNFDTLNQGESNELCKAFMGLFAPIKASASHVHVAELYLPKFSSVSITGLPAKLLSDPSQDCALKLCPLDLF